MTDPALEALWKNVLDHWDDEKAHAVFLDHCQRHDRLAEAAARYRGMTGDHHRGPTAHKRLQGVALLAMAKLESARSSERQVRRDAGKLALILLFLGGTLAVLGYVAASR
ncbi:MAG TPA: hypothetical protein VKZ49_15690 [Polyangiaceae bacterium]|nr:hypothetical protein [Polyangiaceae bacterium]